MVAGCWQVFNANTWRRNALIGQYTFSLTKVNAIEKDEFNGVYVDRRFTQASAVAPGRGGGGAAAAVAAAADVILVVRRCSHVHMRRATLNAVVRGGTHW